MRVAYVQGAEGVSGAMLLGALLDMGASWPVIQQNWEHLPLPSIETTSQYVELNGFRATQLTVNLSAANTALAQQTYTQLTDAISNCHLPSRPRQGLLDMLTRVANAMRRFQTDATPEPSLSVAGISELVYLGCGVVTALDDLKIAGCQAAPLNLGSSSPASDITPIPHPLIVELARDVPVYGDATPGERTTLDGAAILTSLATRYGPLPAMTVCQTGYGAAMLQETLRHVQIIVGEVADQAEEKTSDRIAILEANIDDMNPEFYADIFARLFALGALDVTLTPMFMKKNRPANKLTVLSPISQVDPLAKAMLRETTTFGVRITEATRQKLDRFWRDVETQYGTIPVKCGVLDGQLVQAAPEYDACQRLANDQNIPVRLVYAEAIQQSATWLTES